MKLNQKLIKQLRNGEIAVENNGTLDQLQEIIKEAFPLSKTPYGICPYYNRHPEGNWVGSMRKPYGCYISAPNFYQPELFTGWAKDDRCPEWMVYFKDEIAQYGFDDCEYEWISGVGMYRLRYSEIEDNRPATHEEIEQGLAEEAKRRGYKGGDTIRGIHGTKHTRYEIISFTYDAENDRLLTDESCVIYEAGKWAEIVEQPKPESKTNPNYIKYLVEGIEYSLNYQELKGWYDKVVNYSDDEFMENLPQITHLACIVAYFKGLGVQATISDKGIIHELIHLMTEPNEPTNDLKEIREKFNHLIKLS